MKLRKILLLIILHIFSFNMFPKPQEAGIWWQVELRITVNGSYAYQSDSKGYSGTYSFIKLVLGTLQEDEDDFIFVQAYEKTSGLSWKESVFDDKDNKETDLSKKIILSATLNYVFRRDEELAFDFGMEPVKVPYVNSDTTLPSRKLKMPESAGDYAVKSDHSYEKNIKDGSNQLVLSVKDIYNQKELNKKFKWQWEKKDDSPPGQSSHNVTAILKILRKKINK